MLRGVLVNRRGVIRVRGAERPPGEAVVSEASDGIAGVVLAIGVAAVIKIEECDYAPVGVGG